MAKSDKWERLKEEMDRLADEFDTLPNPTAEQCGMCQAYNYVYVRMRALELSEKKLDKA